mmetsp:Transcript_8111/g.17348  ORF Transcript_8111/g.17348 Transcript_8111/m.17348 type:complete len:215 (-) Transcript_8111:29-673(-)
MFQCLAVVAGKPALSPPSQDCPFPPARVITLVRDGDLVSLFHSQLPFSIRRVSVQRHHNLCLYHRCRLRRQRRRRTLGRSATSRGMGGRGGGRQWVGWHLTSRRGVGRPRGPGRLLLIAWVCRARAGRREGAGVEFRVGGTEGEGPEERGDVVGKAVVELFDELLVELGQVGEGPPRPGPPDQLLLVHRRVRKVPGGYAVLLGDGHEDDLEGVE